MEQEKERLLSEEGYPLSDESILEPCALHEKAWHFFKTWSYSSNQSTRYFGYRFLLSGYFMLLHVLCILLAIALVRTSFLSSHRPDMSILDFDNRYPDWVPVSYELRAEYALENPQSDFTGWPDDRNTKAWDDLITHRGIDQRLRDPTQGGYLAGLGVYHDIHCLRRLRLFLHSNYYYRDLTDTNMNYLREHLGHCIESLRRSVMCNADTNIFTFTWKDAEEVRPGKWRPNPKSNQERKCVQWEALESWVMERHTPLHPRLLRPNGDVERIMMI